MIMTQVEKIDGSVEWACPRCGADSYKHGKGECLNDLTRLDCLGFICECPESPESTEKSHGTHTDPCPDARCYHCGWANSFPPKPKKPKKEMSSTQSGSTNAYDQLRSILKRVELLEAMAEAVEKECSKFDHPDEDRPELWEALQRLR